MITNLAPKSQTLGTLGFVCSVIGMCFKLKSSSAVMGGGLEVCSFRCLFLFWLDCVRLGVSLRARCSN